MKKITTTIIFLILTVLSSNASYIKLYAENDVLAHTDRDYTHGTRITYSYDYTNHVYFLPGESKQLEWSLTQLIYTPNPKTISELQPDERPYAGYLGIGINAVSLYSTRMELEEGIAFGVVGPYSFAEETQKTIHTWIGSSQPMGWDNQLHNEPILSYHYGMNYKLLYNDYFDAISRNDVCVGNMYDYVSSGVMFRLGWGLKHNFAFNRIEPSVRLFDVKKWYGYVFVYPEGRYVAHNIFLDGNTFEDSHSVEKEPFVGDFSYGAALGLDNIELAFSVVRRSPEFKKQEDYNTFGAAMIAVRF